MKASRTDHPRTSPVALRTNSDCSPADAATVAIDPPPRDRAGLAARQHEFLHLLLAVHVNHRPEQLALFVGAARVDAQRLAEACCAPRLVDVAVERQRGLVLLDRLPHRG